jgi:membrane associated rhomboid family serine protease
MIRVSLGPFLKAVVATNILLALLMLVPSLQQQFLLAGGLFPARFGAIPVDAGRAFMLPLWLTPISSAFLHGGLLHLGLNMMMLALVAPSVERVLGQTGIAILYGVGIIASAAAQIASEPNSTTPMVGASGAISALVAAHVALFPRERPKPVGPIPGKWVHALKLLLGWIALNLMLGFVGPGIGVQIAVWAHIGGFAAGLALVWPLLHFRYRNA